MRQRLSAISEQNRATTGVKLQKLDAGDEVVGAAIVPAAEEEEEDDDDEAGGGGTGEEETDADEFGSD